MKAASHLSRLSDSLVLNCKVLFSILRFTICSRPGSYIGITPSWSLLILLLSISMQVTLLPISAKQVPLTKPTYPLPITVKFIVDFYFKIESK